MITVVIPTVTGRSESLQRTVDAYEEHTVTPFRFHVVPNDNYPCGIAWRKGLHEAKTEFVHFSADDLVPHRGWDLHALEVWNRNRALPAAYLENPDGSVQAYGGDLAQSGHVNESVMPDGMTIDYSGVPFLPTELAKKLDLFEGHYFTDVWVSYAARMEGYETIMRRGYAFTHHREHVGRGAGFTEDERGAIDSILFTQKFKERYPATARHRLSRIHR